MKYLLLVLLSFQLSAELDLTIPEQPAVYVPRENILPAMDWVETNMQKEIIIYWTLTVLDVYTTHEGLKDPNVYELNPLLGKRPSLAQLILLKSISSIIILNTYFKCFSPPISFLTRTISTNYKMSKVLRFF